MYRLGPICILSQGGWMCGRQTSHSPSGKFIHPGAYSRYTFFPGDHVTPLPCELLLLCYRVVFGQAVGAAAASNVCTANPALQESTGTCWGQQMRKVMVQLSMDPRKISMTGSGTCRCLGFGSGWLKYYRKVPFWDLLYIDWCLIWNLLLAWKKKAWKHIVNSLEVQCFKAAVLCWTSLAQ